jgi:hypothetical protein
MALPNRMSLRPGLLWLILNVSLIIQCLSRSILFLQFLRALKMSSRNPAVTRKVKEDWMGPSASLYTVEKST